MPAMTVDGIGYGLGTRVFSRPSCVRAFLGESAQKDHTVAELQCNLDDMTGEDPVSYTHLLTWRRKRCSGKAPR